jgi:Flp pilus assembly pilin Flp
MVKLWLSNVLRRVHEDEGGAVTLETLLIIGAIALPILAFILMKVWPTIVTFFNSGMNDLQTDANNVSAGNAASGN